MSGIFRKIAKNNADWAKSAGQGVNKIEREFPKGTGQSPTVTTGTWPKTEKSTKGNK